MLNSIIFHPTQSNSKGRAHENKIQVNPKASEMESTAYELSVIYQY